MASWLGMQQRCAVLHPWIVLPAWLIAQARCSHALCQANKFWDLLVLQAMLMCRLKVGRLNEEACRRLWG